MQSGFATPGAPGSTAEFESFVRGDRNVVKAGGRSEQSGRSPDPGVDP